MAPCCDPRAALGDEGPAAKRLAWKRLTRRLREGTFLCGPVPRCGRNYYAVHTWAGLRLPRRLRRRPRMGLPCDSLDCMHAHTLHELHRLKVQVMCRVGPPFTTRSNETVTIASE